MDSLSWLGTHVIDGKHHKAIFASYLTLNKNQVQKGVNIYGKVGKDLKEVNKKAPLTLEERVLQRRTNTNSC